MGPSAGAADRRRRCRTSSPCRRPRAPAARSAAQRVISEDDTHVKRIVFSPKILAKAVFADPELTLGLPPAVTAATGMDALTHNVESYLSPAYHPLCDGIALEGTRIAARALPPAVREPGNLQARARHDDELDDGRDRVPEGPRRGALLRARARHGLRPAPRPGQRADDRHRARLERRGRAGEVRRAGARRAASSGGARGFVAWLRAAEGRRSASPPAWRRRGVKREQIPRLVEIAVADICHQTNPRPVHGAPTSSACSRQAM